jgi:hypothetical protein
MDMEEEYTIIDDDEDCYRECAIVITIDLREHPHGKKKDNDL